MVPFYNLAVKMQWDTRAKDKELAVVACAWLMPLTPSGSRQTTQNVPFSKNAVARSRQRLTRRGIHCSCVCIAENPNRVSQTWSAAVARPCLAVDSPEYRHCPLGYIQLS